ncbi:hypothetical protein LUZ61_008098 [Rhynchospora tenuis]|uniref:DUF1421 domain-containing protein n=1 Tax=Rhynchospora tenuis TaxID=198213 RepID=A0AAD5ZUW9_9POAL|nr:hypothetical protein LUZ61_008098 [Rhynchospora tenuis]
MASGSRSSFNFGSDDVLCSYDDFAAQDSSSTKRSDPSAKEFPDGRMARPLVNIYEQEDHSKDELVSTVERCMKKYADTLMRSLDGITGRLSQLEIHCYKLERSIGELRGDMVQGQNEADLKFKSLEKHMQEVHRAVQILRDKQELAETQKELAKLQTIQKESGPKPEERAPTPVPESAKHEEAPQLSNNQLALVPSRPQAAQTQQQQQLSLQQPPLSHLPMQQDQYTVNQPTTYYPANQVPTQQLPPGYQYVQVTPAQQPQLPVQPSPQPQPQPQQAPPPQVSQVVNPVPQQPAPIPQFPHQWAPQQQPNPNHNTQQFTPQAMQSSQALPPSQPVQPQAAPPRPHTPPGYSPYPPHQPSNPIPESYPVSMAIPTSYSTAPQPGMNRSDMVPVGYGSQGNTRLPLPNQGSFVASPQMVKTYTNPPPYMQGNMPGYSSGPYNYPPSNAPGIHSGSQQLPRNHPYGEFVEKAVGMGYPREQVTSVAMKFAETGQPMDFNALLDRLNGVSSPSPRAWSG